MEHSVGMLYVPFLIPTSKQAERPTLSSSAGTGTAGVSNAWVSQLQQGRPHVYGMSRLADCSPSRIPMQPQRLSGKQIKRKEEDIKLLEELWLRSQANKKGASHLGFAKVNPSVNLQSLTHEEISECTV